MDIASKWIKVNNQGLEIDTYLAMPEAAGIYPGVIVIQEIFGVNEHIQEVTAKLAREGYVAIAPAIYQRQAPGFAVGYSEAETKLGREYKVKTQAPELLSDIQACITYLYRQPQVKQSGVGTIGFCFGGHVAYLAATLQDVKAIVYPLGLLFMARKLLLGVLGKLNPLLLAPKTLLGQFILSLAQPIL